jgi:UrcA family protein
MKDLATTLIGALTLYAVSTAGFAAAPRDDVRHQVVAFADLDLTRPAGAQELYHRLQYAARNVCQTYDRRGDRDCIRQAIARAVADVGAPLLTTRHQASTARQPLQPRQARLEE